MTDEINRIKEAHKRLRDTIHGEHHHHGDRLYLHGARIGQLGLSSPLIDEAGYFWRLGHDEMSGEYIEYIDPVAPLKIMDGRQAERPPRSHGASGSVTHAARQHFIEAWQFRPSPSADWPIWMQRALQHGHVRATHTHLIVQVLRRDVLCQLGDWLTLYNGHFIVIPGNIFAELFEELEF